jgi:ketosteroid isomerase-like protein
MAASDFEGAFATSHDALRAMGQGDSTLSTSQWSRRGDTTLANPFGPAIVGWGNIAEESARVAAGIVASTDFQFEEVMRVVTPDLGYVVGVERSMIRRLGAEDFVPLTLRVTSVFRREEGQWFLVHRHADRVVT